MGCVQCHLEQWGKAREDGTAVNGAKLDKVVDHIQSYMDSMHARPRIDDQSRTNATCYNCHGSHDIKIRGGAHVSSCECRIFSRASV